MSGKNENRLYFVVFSEGGGVLTRDNIDFSLINAPFIFRELDLPERIFFSVTIGVKYHGDLNQPLVFEIVDPNGKVISNANLHELINKEELDSETKHAHSLITTMTTGNGVLFEVEGEHTVVVRLADEEIGRTYLSIEQKEGDLNG